MGLIRSAIISGKDIQRRDARQAFQSDFYNLTAMLTNGQFHIYTTKRPLPWSGLPVNTILVRGEIESDCYMGQCSPL